MLKLHNTHVLLWLARPQSHRQHFTSVTALISPRAGRLVLRLQPRAISLCPVHRSGYPGNARGCNSGGHCPCESLTTWPNINQSDKRRRPRNKAKKEVQQITDKANAPNCHLLAAFYPARLRPRCQFAHKRPSKADQQNLICQHGSNSTWCETCSDP